MRRTFRALGALALLGLAALLGWIATGPTPPTDRAAMASKYGAPEDRFVDHEGGRIRWRAAGCETCPPVLLLHGLGASVAAWGPLEAELGARFRLISFDFPAHGLSAPRADDDYRAEALARGALAVADAAGLGRFALAGHSLGAEVAATLAASAPERVSALVLIAPPGAPRAAEAPPGPLGRLGAALIHSEALAWVAERWVPRGFIAESLKGAVADPALATPEAVDRYWELLRQPGNRRAQIVWAKLPRDPGRRARYAAIAAPTLILWGAEDRLIPVARAEDWKAAIPGAAAVVFPGLGHLPMEEAPQAAARAMEPVLSGAAAE